MNVLFRDPPDVDYRQLNPSLNLLQKDGHRIRNRCGNKGAETLWHYGSFAPRCLP
jgi:hypothetical protein